MREYILSVIAAAALGSVAIGMCPDGEGQGIKRTVSLIMSLLLIVSVGKPLMGLAEAFETDSLKDRFLYSSESYDEVWRDTLVSVTEDGVREAVGEILINEIGLERDDFSVACELEEHEEQFKIKSVTVELCGAGLLKNPRGIEVRLSEIFECECTVK